MVNLHSGYTGIMAYAPYVHTKASVGARALQAQKDRETDMRCESR